MSTCAYQWTQGVGLDSLLKLHDHYPIRRPDLTFFIDVSPETAQFRRTARSTETEKFEQLKFQRELADNYHSLINRADCSELFGKVITINGAADIKSISSVIKEKFNPFYDEWFSGKLG